MYTNILSMFVFLIMLWLVYLGHTKLALKAFVFYIMVGFLYLGYNNFVHPSHFGNAVNIAYEKGDMKKLASLKCKVYEPNDKNIKVKKYAIYQMNDGKKVACDW